MENDFTTFVMGETTVNQINALPEELQLKFYKAVSNYGINGIEPDFTGLELAVWIPMRDLILHTKQKHCDWLQKQRESGKKGASKRWGRHNSDNEEWGRHFKENENSHNNNNNNNNNDNDKESDASASFDGSDEPPQSENTITLESPKEPTPEEKDALELSELLLTAHRKEMPDYLSGKDKAVIPRWAADIEKLIRIDKKPPETIRRVILWVKTPGNFWFCNVESGKKLREKFERLYGQMVQKQGTGPPRNRLKADEVPPEEMAKLFKEAVT
jgi:hypothetical protein